MKITLILLYVQIFCLISNNAFCQHIYIGSSVGLSNSGFTGDYNKFNGYIHKIGAHYGIFIEKSINKNVAIRMEINYTDKGNRQKEVQQLTNNILLEIKNAPESTLYAFLNTKTSLKYLEIPVLIYFKFPVSKRLNYYINMGLDISFLIKARQSMYGNSFIYFDKGLALGASNRDGALYPELFLQDRNIIEDKYKKIDLSTIGGIGFNYIINRGTVFLECRFADGWINILRQSDQNIERYNSSLIFIVGYIYKIK